MPTMLVLGSCGITLCLHGSGIAGMCFHETAVESQVYVIL